MLYPSLHLHLLKTKRPDDPTDVYIQPDAIEQFQPEPDGGSCVFFRGGDGGFCKVKESPDMIAKAIHQAIRGAKSLETFGQFDAEKAINDTIQQGANGVALVQKPGLMVPG